MTEEGLGPCIRLLHAEATPESRRQAVEELARRETEPLMRLLLRHRLDQLVLRSVLDGGWQDLLPEASYQDMLMRRRRSAMELMLREEAARRAGEALAMAEIPYVFFKGIHVGELLWGDPLLRPSADVDLLVAESDRHGTHRALLDGGFQVAPQEDQPPYELAYFGHGAHLDVHRHPISPTRSRRELTSCFLENRQEHEGLFYPPAEATALALLLNPALTDHISERLIQSLDVDRFLRRQPCDWQTVVDWLRQAGLRPGAWAMLEHTRRLFDTPIPQPLEEGLKPAVWRRHLIRRWLDHDPARIYQRRPLWVRAGLGSLLHDSLAHGLWALVLAARERRQSTGTGLSS